MLEASICLSTFNKPHLLPLTLKSIFAQHPPFEFEVIVVDDGSTGVAVREICEKFPVRYHRIERESVFRNPCVARNVAYKLAVADVIISQSDEVVHKAPDCIERLVRDLEPGHMLFAHVLCENKHGHVSGVYTGPSRQAPFFFLGSLFREDLYAIGGNDEEFIICPAWEDKWFADCLMRGRGLRPVFTTHIVGHHLYHEYCTTPETEGPSRDLYRRKCLAAMAGEIPWCASGGPWPFVRPANDEATERTPTNQAEETFAAIYRTSHWGNGESKSGAGSSLTATEQVRKALPGIVERYGIKSMLDIPCGDFHWMRKVDLPGVRYIGGDIVGELIQLLAEQYQTETRTFQQLDIMSSDLPRSDLVVCRDCLGHLSFVDARRALDNVIRSGSKYFLATTFTGRHDNRTIRTGEWYPYNLQDEPFCLPEPIEIVNENCQEWHPHFADKSIGLWRVADLAAPTDRIKSLAVCVEYDDFLAITLPRNMRHFTRTLVVTSPADTRTQDLAKQHGAECYVTDAFYRNGAAFNKGLAIEEAFDVLGRDGWICVWDADIVMPDCIQFPREIDCLYSPARHILDDPATYSDDLTWLTLPSPTQPHEFDGYFQMFHSLTIDPPWYGTGWRHAGGCDSDFQFRFSEASRRRPPFSVLHLGSEGIPEIGVRIGRNWRGRVTPRIDTGEVLPMATVREAEIRQMVVDRRLHGTVRERL